MTDEDDELTFAEWEGVDSKFALRVTGDAMIDAHIQNGDYVVLEKATRANDGQIVAFRDEDGEVLLRTYFQEKHQVRLEPSNKDAKPIFRANVDILGVLVGVVRKY